MRHFTVIFLSILCLSTSVRGQSKDDCFEVKHLDFFGIEDLDTVRWPNSQLDDLLKTDFDKDVKGKVRKTNFLIPFIMMQLKDYYPSCSGSTDTVTFRKLKQLYFKIRKQEVSSIDNQPTSKQLEIIRDDYYAQVQNDSLLPFMAYSLDDGPFYGQHPGNIPDYKKGASFKMDFGTLYITKESGSTFLTVFDNQGGHLWTRMMTGYEDRPLGEIKFYEKDIWKTSLGYQLRMFSEGEALNLYLKNDGDFRYYFRSW